MGKPAFQPGPAFGVKRVYSINDKFPVLKVGHQPPTQQGINVGIDNRQTMEEVGNIDILWGMPMMRRFTWFALASNRWSGLCSSLV